MVYIVATLLRKAFNKYDKVLECQQLSDCSDELWKALMLKPMDYSYTALNNQITRDIMEKIEFAHGGPEYDKAYPEGIPTSVQIVTKQGKTLDSGMILHPGGHARNTTIALHEVLQSTFSHYFYFQLIKESNYSTLSQFMESKFKSLGSMALDKNELIRFKVGLENIGEMSNEELVDIYDCNIKFTEDPIDQEPTHNKDKQFQDEDANNGNSKQQTTAGDNKDASTQ